MGLNLKVSFAFCRIFVPMPRSMVQESNVTIVTSMLLGPKWHGRKKQLNSTNYKPCISSAKFTSSIINFLETLLKIGSHQVIKYGNLFSDKVKCGDFSSEILLQKH